MSLIILLTEGAGQQQGNINIFDMGTMLLPMALMVGMIYFMFIRPESKRKKKTADMLANIEIADEVVTAGGIIGRVIQVDKENDVIVIETGGDKTRIRIIKSYIIENRTVHDDV
ncbi:MAG: preprotein translocase subunit YajC [Oscillospiraceae bacterium]|nr:preprotein translocase subunit YajC [Oscillospiraceae bacterium]